MNGTGPGSKKYRWSRGDLIIMALIAAATFVLYFRTVHFDFIGFDDPVYVSKNRMVLSGLNGASIHYALTAFVTANWHPLTMVTELVVVSLFGSHPGNFHLVNAFLHAINASLLYAFLIRTTSMRWRSFVVAALWAWHPLRVESVAWISELKDVLCGCFWLLCMLAYARYREQPRMGRYLAVFVLMALALLAKPMAVTLPFALLLLDVWPIGTTKWWPRFVEKLPLVGLSLAAAFIAVHTQSKGQSVVSLRNFPISIRLENALVSYASYLGKTFVPIHLAIFYPHPKLLQHTIPLIHWVMAASVLLLISAWVVLVRRHKPYLFVGWLWFIGILVPVIGLVQVGEQAMADRYSYLPSIGLTIAVVWFAADLLTQARKLAFVKIAGAAAICAGAVVVSVIQIGYWRDTKTLFQHANWVVRNNYRARAILSNVALEQGDNSGALSLARSAEKLAPLSRDAHNAMAMALEACGKYPRAMEELNFMLKEDPSDAEAHNDLGGLLLRENRNDDAMAEFQKAVKLRPDYAAARHNLAARFAERGQYPQAVEQWKKAVALDPKSGMYQGWLAEALRLTGDRQGAVEHYLSAWKLGERNAVWQTNLAWFVAIDASTTPQRAAELVPVAKDAAERTDDPHAADALAALDARCGRFDDAVNAAAKASAQARAQGKITLAKEIDRRTQGYRAGRIYLER